MWTVKELKEIVNEVREKFPQNWRMFESWVDEFLDLDSSLDDYPVYEEWGAPSYDTILNDGTVMPYLQNYEVLEKPENWQLEGQGTTSGAPEPFVKYRFDKL